MTGNPRTTEEGQGQGQGKGRLSRSGPGNGSQPRTCRGIASALAAGRLAGVAEHPSFLAPSPLTQTHQDPSVPRGVLCAAPGGGHTNPPARRRAGLGGPALGASEGRPPGTGQPSSPSTEVTPDSCPDRGRSRDHQVPTIPVGLRETGPALRQLQRSDRQAGVCGAGAVHVTMGRARMAGDRPQHLRARRAARTRTLRARGPLPRADRGWSSWSATSCAGTRRRTCAP